MSEVEAYYDENAAREWQRLKRHRTEHAVTLRAMEEFLPLPPASILDIGGGPGRYAIELTRRGYDVTLVDLSGDCLAMAQEKARQAGITLHLVVQANALDLSAVPARIYDAVLMMGPLYHLHETQDRLRAVVEAKRFLPQKGILFTAFITRYAAIRYYLINVPGEIDERWESIQVMLDQGLDLEADRFRGAYYAHPAEIEPLLAGAGFDTLCLLGCEGIVAGNEEHINELSGANWERWVDLNYRLAKESPLLGAADHIVFIGRKSS
jgi:ubiquinone/menaquinone biosynthesis C-methylase UbiE